MASVKKLQRMSSLLRPLRRFTRDLTIVRGFLSTRTWNISEQFLFYVLSHLANALLLLFTFWPFHNRLLEDNCNINSSRKGKEARSSKCDIVAKVEEETSSDEVSKRHCEHHLLVKNTIVQISSVRKTAKNNKAFDRQCEHYKGVKQRDPRSPVGLAGDVRDVGVAQGGHLGSSCS